MATLIRIENRETQRARSAMIKARKLQFTILIAEQKRGRRSRKGVSHKASTDHRDRVSIIDARLRGM